MSMVTYGELRYGAEKSARRDESLAVLVRLAELIPVLAPEAAGERYGIVRAELEEAASPSATMTCGSPPTPWRWAWCW